MMFQMYGTEARPSRSRGSASRLLGVLATGAAMGAAAMGLAVGAPGAALAQSTAMERHLPPAAEGTGGGLRPGPAPAASGDDTPLGVDVAGFRLIGLNGAIIRQPQAGITVAGAEGLDDAGFRKALAPFIGKPLSRKLLTEVQAAVAQAYREAGRPFVSVTAPPQEITSGVLHLRAVAFRTGRVQVQDGDGGPQDPDPALAAGLRAPTGQLIEADRISEDLDWLNRFPYRQLNGVFEPGSDPGTSNLTLELSRRKPWQAFAGWSNTSSVKDHDSNRLFAGFSAGIEAMHDLTVAYQFTGSPDVVSNPASVGRSDGRWPTYVSHAGRIAAMTFPRQALSIAPNYVATGQESAGNLLTFHTTTVELPILYRSALSNIDERLAGWGDIYGGITPKWMSRKTLYQGTTLGNGSAGVFDLTAGWAVAWQRAGNDTADVDVRAVVNRTGIVPGNTDANWNSFTNGRVAGADYAYGYGTFNQATALTAIPALTGFTWTTAFTGQIAGKALPETEQLALGGYYAARGYTLRDGSADTGFVLRNELRLPAFPILGALETAGVPGVGRLEDAAAPFAFLDVAYGHTYNLDALQGVNERADTRLVGLGLGLDYTLGRSVQGGLSVGVALTDGPETDRGTVTAQARLLMSF
ncbi:ShlB/FhaC/HecB family hemolysin secretion/activation protein (plasmid) [Azospirillum humicireducens]|uniref:ShlB/FhaC/HecB family hemolysin secretion/activation protein n=1 Tax=Azospirillum humicireducens TaxID=1226968 RepID=A0A2R4VU02_9PROT|nr:ShlB/FhaC/HecB family hemolysin secretion/activation protein [Azospirillum humicireducens]AWB07913.1 ShlB/FhaC/HecB family hemolysin secretion/activation protein [Azospirillum humicireducens]